MSLESEPLTGKSHIANLLVNKLKFNCGNSEISETLCKNLTSNFQGWIFEYCLAKILSVQQRVEGSVVYKGLFFRTLVDSLRDSNALSPEEHSILGSCCRMFLEHIKPDVVLYSSSDFVYPMTDHKHTSKNLFYLRRLPIVKGMYRELIRRLEQKCVVIRLSNQYPYTDGVIAHRLLFRLRELLMNAQL